MNDALGHSKFGSLRREERGIVREEIPCHGALSIFFLLAAAHSRTWEWLRIIIKPVQCESNRLWRWIRLEPVSICICQTGLGVDATNLVLCLIYTFECESICITFASVHRPIVPMWKAQAWYPMLLSHATEHLCTGSAQVSMAFMNSIHIYWTENWKFPCSYKDTKLNMYKFKACIMFSTWNITKFYKLSCLITSSYTPFLQA